LALGIRRRLLLLRRRLRWLGIRLLCVEGNARQTQTS
jgi:hypothetical protein